MQEFFGNNILFIFTITGAVLSFLGSIIGLTSEKKPILIMATLLTLGFTVGIAYQITKHGQENEKALAKAAKEQIEEAAQQTRDNIINEINVTVGKTKVTVDTIAEKLNKASITEIATTLVSPNSDVRFDAMAAFAKGSPAMWEGFASVLAEQTNSNTSSSLELSLDGNHHYDSGLLLAYLLTSKNTAEELKHVVERRDSWSRFPAEKLFISTYMGNENHLQWIVFYGNNNVPVAFANAKQFTEELMVYHRMEEHDRINRLLNQQPPENLKALQAAFPSIQTDVFRSVSPEELIKQMIEKRLSVALTSADHQNYIAHLAQMIQVAAKVE